MNVVVKTLDDIEHDEKIQLENEHLREYKKQILETFKKNHEEFLENVYLNYIMDNKTLSFDEIEVLRRFLGYAKSKC